ncbi:hypothetical protein, partial [Brevibacterium otitidis]|uniref:hypothetical protein n=1 Tax=Brevibacterium otitidis TaxID=53364 RepID=UPI00360CE903
LFRVECGHADRARVLEIDVEVLDDERTLTSAYSKDLDNAYILRVPARHLWTVAVAAMSSSASPDCT